MKPNKTKCELITNHKNARLHFPDKTPIQQNNNDIPRVRNRNNNGMQRRTKQQICNNNGNNEQTCLLLETLKLPAYIKIYTADTVFRSTLYGLESAQLIPSVLQQINISKLKVLTPTLNKSRTYIHRVNSNASIFNRISTIMEDKAN